MVTNRKKICYLAISNTKEYQPVKDTVQEACEYVGFSLITSPSNSNLSSSIQNVLNEIKNADLFIADVSETISDFRFLIDFAKDIDKPFFLIYKKQKKDLNQILDSYSALQYSISARGLKQLSSSILRILEQYKESLQRLDQLKSNDKFIPLLKPEKLDPRQFENLCVELLSQMGFQQVKWEKSKRFIEIDAVAFLPKKDPDGYTYNEIWLISMGLNFPLEMMVYVDPLQDRESFLLRMLRHSNDASENVFPDYKIDSETPITFLFILRDEDESIRTRSEIEQLERRDKRSTVRFRLWDNNYLKKLIRQHPQIAYKYFSEDVQNGSYRKTTEQLYEENVNLTEKLLLIKNRLEEEKKKRIAAERDAVWKDITLRTAHKVGNPVDAIDNFLQSIKKNLKKKDYKKVAERTNDMDASIEKAKEVITQFKSLAKSQELSLKPTDILPLIKESCRVAGAQGVQAACRIPKKIPLISIDAPKISECFDELVANSIHWFNKDEKKKIKKIDIEIKKAAKNKLPDILVEGPDYVRIIFKDNGPGIPAEEKEEIFAPFKTNSVHGTGMGLFLVKSIIEAHGGRIFEVGEEGKGAEFEIFLPLAK